MARRSQESFQKRARERARQEKQSIKRAKREDASSDEASISRSEEDLLMQEFARLNAQYEADQISSARFDEERQRIFSELGLDPDQ